MKVFFVLIVCLLQLVAQEKTQQFYQTTPFVSGQEKVLYQATGGKKRRLKRIDERDNIAKKYNIPRSEIRSFSSEELAVFNGLPFKLKHKYAISSSSARRKIRDEYYEQKAKDPSGNLYKVYTFKQAQKEYKSRYLGVVDNIQKHKGGVQFKIQAVASEWRVKRLSRALYGLMMGFILTLIF